MPAGGIEVVRIVEVVVPRTVAVHHIVAVHRHSSLGSTCWELAV